MTITLPLGWLTGMLRNWSCETRAAMLPILAPVIVALVAALLTWLRVCVSTASALRLLPTSRPLTTFVTVVVFVVPREAA